MAAAARSGRMPAEPAAVVAVDGGNSKAEALLVARDGSILAAARSATASHQQVGLEGMAARFASLARAAHDAGGASRPGDDAGATDDAGDASGPIAELGSYCLAGADFPAEVRMIRGHLEPLGLATRTTIRNDTLAALRAGAPRGWGAALICGQGVNGVAVGPTGRTATFDALGDISGDWGGGTSVGWAGLAAAVRAADGRGGPTSLRTLVPAHFGRSGTKALVRAFYREEIGHERIGELSPLVFRAARDGDAEDGAIVDRLAEELAAMAIALLRRTGQTRLDADLVLAGGVLQAGDERLIEGLLAKVRRMAPNVHGHVLAQPPVLGAALLGLDELLGRGAALDAADGHLRAAVREVRFTTVR
jgi:N-acetylglucosamine kinase-like BadF-type ATPase